MKGLWAEYKNILSDLKYGLKRFIKYQICTKILIGIILLPFLKVILNSLMKSRGLSYITNGLLTKFLLSPQGIISILLLIIFATFVILIEIGGLIVLSHQVITKDKESSYYTIFKYCIRRIKHFIGINGLIIALGIVVILPWLDIGIHTSLISNIKIPGFVKDVIDNNVFFSMLLKALTITFFILAIRWIFTMHGIMLKNKTSKKALKESSILVKKNLKVFVKRVLGIGLINILVVIALAILYLIITFIVMGVVIAILGDADVYIKASLIAIFAIGIILLGIGVFILQPFSVLHMTRVFYDFNNGQIPNLTLEEKGNKSSLGDKVLNSKKAIIALFVTAVAITSLFTLVMIEEMENIKYNVKITAHRGSSKEAPGNTLEALDIAIKNGADYAEIDVQETKDGELVLLHDKSLSRTTGLNKNVWEVTLDEIKQLDSGSWFDKKYKGVKIPTLEEVIDHCKGKINLNIEIKTNGHEKDLIHKVVKLIKKKDLMKSCVVTSLDYEAIQKVESIEPKIKTGYIMFVAMGDLKALNLDFYSVEETNVTESFVTEAHMLGREVHVWTINEEADMDKVIDLGVDNIITDNDKILREKLNKLKREALEGDKNEEKN